MNVQRSPTGGSQPDLSKMSGSNLESSITFRKRKVPSDIECSCSDDIREMRSEISRISSLLEKYVESNEQILKTMQSNITEIKNQITEMQSSNDHTHKSVQNKIELLESDINQLKMREFTTKTSEKDVVLGEKNIQEIQLRSNREKNVVLVGLPEQIVSSPEERSTKDQADVFRIISLVSPGIPNPSKVFRVGKVQPGKNRSIKICFDTMGPAKKLLVNRNKLQDGLKIFSDQTPTQQNYMKKLREELKQRQDKGETNLTIKYINGTPSIINNTSKNYLQ